MFKLLKTGNYAVLFSWYMLNTYHKKHSKVYVYICKYIFNPTLFTAFPTLACRNLHKLPPPISPMVFLPLSHSFALPPQDSGLLQYLSADLGILFLLFLILVLSSYFGPQPKNHFLGSILLDQTLSYGSPGPCLFFVEHIMICNCIFVYALFSLTRL